MDAVPAPSPFLLAFSQTFKIKWQCQERDCCCLMSFNWVTDWSLTPCNDRLITPSAEALGGGIIIFWAFFLTGKLISYYAWARCYYCKSFCNKRLDIIVFQTLMNLWPPVWHMLSVLTCKWEKKQSLNTGLNRKLSVMHHKNCCWSCCSSWCLPGWSLMCLRERILVFGVLLIWLRSLHWKKCFSSAAAAGDWDQLQLALC